MVSDRWIALWRRIGAGENPEPVYSRLVALHSEPHRVYHTLGHIAHCLEELGEVRHLPEHPDEVELAVWFHDAVYDPRARDNEERSAWLAFEVCQAAGLPEPFTRRVSDLILATQHEAVPEGMDARVLVDIDLSILGRPGPEFDEYEKNIRREYAWVPDGAFRAGRAAVLQRFLARSSIFATEWFQRKYELPARRNIARSLARWKS